MTATAVRDLAEQVHDFLTDAVTDNALAGFTVHRHVVDGTAAVTFRPGIVPAYASVLRWTLTTWAGLLRDAGFTVEVDARDDRGQVDVPQVLRVLGRVETLPTPELRNPTRERPGVTDRPFPALVRDLAEQVIRHPATDSTRAQLIEAALDERGLGNLGTPTRETLHGAVLDAISAARLVTTTPNPSAQELARRYGTAGAAQTTNTEK